MTKKSTSFSIALGGMLAALSLLFMFLTVLFPIAEFVFPGIAGVLLIAAVYELGEKWAFGIFAVVGILSLLLPIEKSSAIYYIFFLGHYPIVKSYIERVKNKIVEWIVKVLFFNICAVAAFLVSVFVFNLNAATLKYGLLFTALLFNVTFVIYDLGVSNIVALYAVRLRKVFKKHL